MGDGDQVTQKQFYDGIKESDEKVLTAIGKVDETVGNLRVDVKEVSTKQAAYEKRMDAQDKKIEQQSNWNRGLAAVEALLASFLIALGIRGD